MLIEVIYTLDTPFNSQSSANLTFSKPPSEAEFLYRAFYHLDYALKRSIQKLRKISACHIVERDEPTPEWLLDSNGKYYFNAE